MKELQIYYSPYHADKLLKNGGVAEVIKKWEGVTQRPMTASLTERKALIIKHD